MSSAKYTIVFTQGSVSYKVCKILFGTDGSYYVTAPYHPHQKALLAIFTVNFDLQIQTSSSEEAVDLADLEDDDRRVKLSHHPSGFVQFSGQGIVSGKDEDGATRGIGTMSWPLENPTRGPAFAITIGKVEQFQQVTTLRDQACIFRSDEMILLPEPYVLTLEGYYFPALWRRFIQSHPDGTKYIQIIHPAGVVLTLKVLLPPPDYALQGFLGLELYSLFAPGDSEDAYFILSGPTGNLRKNDEGQTLGDGIYCFYPRGPIETRRNLNYRMPSVQPQQGSGPAPIVGS